jgi:uncharacterized protein (TIGR00251 family)
VQNCKVRKTALVLRYAHWRIDRILNSRQALIPVHDTPAGATFQVKVHPRARKNTITGVLGDALKLSLTAPPIEGHANKACIEFLAKFLNVPRSSVTIAAGESSRQKLIRVAGVRAAQVEEKLRAILG